MSQNVDWIAGNGQRSSQFWVSGPSFRESLGKLLLYRIEACSINNIIKQMYILKLMNFEYIISVILKQHSKIKRVFQDKYYKNKYYKTNKRKRKIYNPR